MKMKKSMEKIISKLDNKNVDIFFNQNNNNKIFNLNFKNFQLESLH